MKVARPWLLPTKVDPSAVAKKACVGSADGAAHAGKGAAPASPLPREMMLSAGARLVREWSGRTISVDVSG